MRSISKAAIFGAILICGRTALADVQYTKLCDFGKAPDFEAISIDCRHLRGDPAQGQQGNHDDRRGAAIAL